MPRVDKPEIRSVVTLTDLIIDDTTTTAPKVEEKSVDIEVFLGTLKNIYGVAMDQMPNICKYLTKHRDMISVIDTAVINAKRLFDEKTELSLEMYYDIDSEEQNLTLYVRQENYEEDVMRKIDMICDIYEPEMENKSDWFLVTTDFQFPKYK
jgi:hypothetical protein